MIVVGIGGFFGAICRYILGLWLTPKWSTRFPMTTWLINSSGSFALGVLTSIDLSKSLALLLATGFLGAYTTFSTFGFETIRLIEFKLYKCALIYIGCSVIIGILFAWLGYTIGCYL